MVNSRNDYSTAGKTCLNVRNLHLTAILRHTCEIVKPVPLSQVKKKEIIRHKMIDSCYPSIQYRDEGASHLTSS